MGTASSAADVGAHYIAVELAVALRKLGSAVTLVGAGRHLLLEVDAALVRGRPWRDGYVETEIV